MAASVLFPAMLLRAVTPADHPAILALNAAEVRHTSAMDIDALRAIIAMSTYARVAVIEGEIAAFLLALPAGTAYASDNYRWFDTRYPAFLYVDRVVVDARFAGRGIGSRLYDDLFAFAREGGVPMIALEYNIEPPNDASRRFHDKFGFREVGTQWLAGGSKRVSLQVASLTSPDRVAPARASAG